MREAVKGPSAFQGSVQWPWILLQAQHCRSRAGQVMNCSIGINIAHGPLNLYKC